MWRRVTGLHRANERCQTRATLHLLSRGSIRTRGVSFRRAVGRTPVGTRVWTRRKPRELSSTGSLVPMYIPSVGGKYWFYFADMTTICHRVSVPFVYTRTWVCTRSHELVSRGLTWARVKRIFHGRRRRGTRPVSREVVQVRSCLNDGTGRPSPSVLLRNIG